MLYEYEQKPAMKSKEFNPINLFVSDLTFPADLLQGCNDNLTITNLAPIEHRLNNLILRNQIKAQKGDVYAQRKMRIARFLLCSRIIRHNRNESDYSIQALAFNEMSLIRQEA